MASKKFKVVIFTRKRPVEICSFKWVVNIPVVNQVTYLGLRLDQNLWWKSHLNYITIFAAKWANMLRSISGIG